MNDRIEYLRDKANALPMLPGVYIMKDKGGKIIYIGKAKRLKNRVSSYFNNTEKYIKVERMVDHVFDFNYIICDSEYEALVLECSQIKLHKPKYNVLLKDDRGYSYLKITKEEYPKLETVFKKDDKNAEYLGPYYSNYIIKNTLEQARDIFKLPDCQKSFPRDFKKTRPCLNYHIGKCMGLCRGNISKDEYNEAIKNALAFIKGGQTESIEHLKLKMEQAANKLDFETAAKYRDRINALKKSKEKQKVIASSYKREDVIATALSENKICFTVFVFKNYSLNDCRQYIIGFDGDKEKVRSDFLLQFYSHAEIPARIVIDGPVADKELLERFFSNSIEKKVSIILPLKGDQNKLLNMASLNSAEYLAKHLGRDTHATAALDELSTLLGLKKVPEYIESYDISHLGGTNTVAGMVVFKNGVPLKTAYKKFNIKTAGGGDDYAALEEVITRRFNEYEKADSNEGFGRLPDLILIDGGKGQLSKVKPIIDKYGVPTFGMVKDSKHKTRALSEANGDIVIKSNRKAFTLITKIQDETHRFAITFQRKKRESAGLLSNLTQINGVQKVRAQKLLSHFKTLKAVKTASIDELSRVVPKNIAKNIYDYFN